MKCALLALSLTPLLQDAPDTLFELPDYQLTVDLSAFEDVQEDDLESGAAGGQLRRRWSAKLGGSDVDIGFWALGRQEFGLEDPYELIELLEENRHSAAVEKGDSFAFQESFPVAGALGQVPYGWAGIHTQYEGTKPTLHLGAFGGLLAEEAYWFEITCEPALGKQELPILRDFLAKSVTYAGEAYVPEWTEEEAQARWEEVAPERVRKQDKLSIVRTKHYIILTNMRAGGTTKKFGKKMEEVYERIRDLFPFEDVEGQKLLPVYLFRGEDQYQDFLVEYVGQSPEQARRSAGVAWKDFYATSYAAPNDPIHTHEGTHQIFKKRLRLNGGGSWFQEGVADYAETRANDRKVFRNAVKSGEALPLRELMALGSLIYSTEIDKKHGDQAGDLYLHSSCVIEFARESKWGKKKFLDFVHAVGRVPRNDIDAIEKAIQSVYGVGIDGFEERFLEYWKKR